MPNVGRYPDTIFWLGYEGEARQKAYKENISHSAEWLIIHGNPYGPSPSIKDMEKDEELRKDQYRKYFHQILDQKYYQK